MSFFFIYLYQEYVNVAVLVPEHQAYKADGAGILIISPFVMLHLLFALNHHRLGDTGRSQQSVQDLHTRMLYDNGTYVPTIKIDISWQILGICQQTCGDYMGTLNHFSIHFNKPNAIAYRKRLCIEYQH